MRQTFKKSVGFYAYLYGASSLLLIPTAGFIYYTAWQSMAISQVLHTVLLVSLSLSACLALPALMSSIKGLRILSEKQKNVPSLVAATSQFMILGVFGSLTLLLVSSSLIVSSAVTSAYLSHLFLVGSVFAGMATMVLTAISFIINTSQDKKKSAGYLLTSLFLVPILKSGLLLFGLALMLPNAPAWLFITAFSLMGVGVLRELYMGVLGNIRYHTKVVNHASSYELMGLKDEEQTYWETSEFPTLLQTSLGLKKT